MCNFSIHKYDVEEQRLGLLVFAPTNLILWGDGQITGGQTRQYPKAFLAPLVPPRPPRSFSATARHPSYRINRRNLDVGSANYRP